MKFANDRIIKDMNITNITHFGVDGLIKKVKELENRIKALETPKKRGRPAKVING